MPQEDFKNLLNGIRDDFKIVIDDLINSIEIIKDDVEKLKLNKNISGK